MESPNAVALVVIVLAVRAFQHTAAYDASIARWMTSGDPLPETMDAHAGAVIFGGPMSANDDFDWLKAETDWIGTVLKSQTPFLGLCLGAQMLAKYSGARVYTHEKGMAEIGYYPLHPTPEGMAFSEKTGLDWPCHVYQWHREGFDLPRGTELLAEGDSFPVQAFSVHGTAFALQFHMDVTHAMMCRWTTRGHERMTLPNAKPRETHFEGRLLHDPACRAWLSDFIDHWLKPSPLPKTAPARLARVDSASV